MKNPQKHRPMRKNVSIDDYTTGILSGNRTILAQAITLIESKSSKHLDIGQKVIQSILPHTGNSIRIGITGVPGAGKSTVIDSFGMMLCEKGHKVAVLTVDPSSSKTKGSILGDKTRMDKLSKHPNAYIRPSPTNGALGGVTRKSRESILLCEAAGYDVIIVETVGVGQSETTVQSMVDFFLVMVLTGAGDELQGMKKGIIEMADAIFINKADGENAKTAKALQAEYNQILQYFPCSSEGWRTKAFTLSALTGQGIEQMWKIILNFTRTTKPNGNFYNRRKTQQLEWLQSLVEDEVLHHFYHHPDIKIVWTKLSRQVEDGSISPTQAARVLLEKYNSMLKPLN
ncbi:methylmalonyl Co-A mutase-associated GTPase MeaB [Bacillus alkalicellulosilyticus]|uniref:methylmalonyl Co-A mutase-associated GTPase MeaB n=1 Tax=Alkalihalobacterium alkalicellulosilyticum TaxID=1912214 RepID=UPI0009985CA4|nr:methylmalonyl Co-A mutase-associated GTPase MeaB [Bacillus alkalicellulosilyticus]